MAKTFWNWIDKTQITNDAAGDFIADAKADPRPRPPIRSLAKLSSTIQQRDACQKCLDTLPEVWQRFHQWRASRET